jgi:hypothetical protein
MSFAVPWPRPKNLYPHGLHLPFIALGGSLAPALTCTSSLEIRSKATPPPRSARVHSQEQAPFGPAVPLPDHVPPSWFLTTLTAFSARRAMGLLHPTPGQGFTTFHASRHPTQPEGSDGAPLALPAVRFVPSEVSPSSAAVLHHCSRCPLVVPSTQPLPRASSGLQRMSTRRPRSLSRVDTP